MVVEVVVGDRQQTWDYYIIKCQVDPVFCLVEDKIWKCF